MEQKIYDRVRRDFVLILIFRRQKHVPNISGLSSTISICCIYPVVTL